MRGGGGGGAGRREERRRTYLNETKALGSVELVLDNGDRNDATVRPEHVLDVLLDHLWRADGGREGGWEGGREGGKRSEMSRYDSSG